MRTAVQEIIRSLHLDSSTVGSSVVNDIKREIIKAMQFFDTEAPWFLIDRSLIAISVGKDRYPLPDYFRSLVGDIMFIPDISQPQVAWPLPLVPYNEARRTQGGDDDDLWMGNQISEGDTRRCAIDPFSMEIILSPIPDRAITALEVTFNRVSDIPTYSHDGNANPNAGWNFLSPDKITTLADTFTNLWLDNAYELIVYKATASLLSGIYGGSEAAMAKKQDFENAAVLEMNRLRLRHNRRIQALTIPKNI